MKGSPPIRAYRNVQQRAKELRKDMTPAEKILWQELRANKLGVHFRRQQVITGFIVTFTVTKRVWLLNLMAYSMRS